MALYSGRILVRKGLESDFDAEKLMPGEWALSTDKKIVRICVLAGVTIRMATYEAFEEDMGRVEEILRTCQSIQEAVTRINTEFDGKANAVVEYLDSIKTETEEIKNQTEIIKEETQTLRNEAENFRNEAESFKNQAGQIVGIGIATSEKAGLVKPDGTTIRVDADGTIHADSGTVDYAKLENKPTINGTELNGDKTLEELGIASAEELDKTTQKVDTIIEKADLGIKETASGENIHLTDSAENKVVEFALYGKATQDGEPTPENPVDIEVSGESYNLLENTATSQTINGITFTVNKDKSITANGTATGNIANVNIISSAKIPFLENNEKYIISGCNGGSEPTYEIFVYEVGKGYAARNYNGDSEFIYNADSTYNVGVVVRQNVTVNNLTFKPMIRKASVKNDRYMPYGKGSVEVKSCGKNLLKNTATSKTVNGITFTVNEEDGSVIVNGTATNVARLDLATNMEIKEEMMLNGCPSGGSTTTYGIQAYIGGNKYDLGDGVKLGVGTWSIRINIYSGYTANNLVFKPMISLEGGEYEPYQETKPTIPTDGLAGIPVSSGGNYTDSNGQQWICDEIVKYADGSGEFVQRINKIISDGSSDEGWNYDSSNKRFILNNIPYTKTENIRKYVLCSHGLFSQSSHEYGTAFIYNTDLFYYKTDINSVPDFKTWLAKNNITIYYELAEPIRTPLTAEQIAEIEKVRTFYPVTNISNDFDCGMRVKYLADSKNYIDNQLALQAQAREQEMMAMFMLLPEETQAAMIENDINNLLLESEV